MPFYEFYCPDCHTIFNFFSRSVDTQTRPDCPRCGRPQIERRVSIFAISKGRSEEGEGEMPDVDEDRLARAFASMEGELSGLDDEEDPKAAARAMRRLFDASGLRLGPGMEEAIGRMEAGEDPDTIEEELGDVLENEEPFGVKARAGLRDVRRFLPPRVDEGVYEL